MFEAIVEATFSAPGGGLGLLLRKTSGSVKVGDEISVVTTKMVWRVKVRRIGHVRAAGKDFPCLVLELRPGDVPPGTRLHAI